MKTLLKSLLKLFLTLAIVLIIGPVAYAQFNEPEFEVPVAPDPIWTYHICVDAEGYEVDCDEPEEDVPDDPPPEEPEDEEEFPEETPEVSDPPLIVKEQNPPALTLQGSGSIIGGCTLSTASQGGTHWNLLGLFLLGFGGWIPVLWRRK